MPVSQRLFSIPDYANTRREGSYHESQTNHPADLAMLRGVFCQLCLPHQPGRHAGGGGGQRLCQHTHRGACAHAQFPYLRRRADCERMAGRPLQTAAHTGLRFCDHGRGESDRSLFVLWCISSPSVGRQRLCPVADVASAGGHHVRLSERSGLSEGRGTRQLGRFLRNHRRIPACSCHAPPVRSVPSFFCAPLQR